jgi:signal transduction histidine kinase
MSLRRKFIILIFLVAAAIAANLGAVLWSIQFLEREVAGPLRSFQEVLSGLSDTKRTVGEVHASLASPPGSDEPSGPMIAVEPGAAPERTDDFRREFEDRASRILAELDLLESLESYPLRAGLSTARNLRSRIEAAMAGTRKWFETSNPELPLRRELLRSLFTIHELIEMIERRLLDELDSTRLHNDSVRWQILGILGASTLVVALLLGEAALFMHRWALQPIARLRAATGRLAAGDLEHRIEITGRDEIAQLSGEVNQMASTIARMQAERIERERLAAVGEVVRRIVHNLRNPLAGIRSLAEYTQSELPESSELRENQQRIMQTVDRFERWLAEMLSATRPLEVHPADHAAGPWLAGIVDLHRPAAEARGVRLDIDVAAAPEATRFDSRHLEQAVIALVTNAIEASPRGGTVAISAGPAKDTAWRIRVSDQGKGVPHDLRDRIFRPYFTTKPEGSGIGLAIAYQVVAQHGGKITVGTPPPAARNGLGGPETPLEAPGLGPGAEFTVVLPLSGLAESGQGGTKGGGRGENSSH